MASKAGPPDSGPPPTQAGGSPPPRKAGRRGSMSPTTGVALPQGSEVPGTAGFVRRVGQREWRAFTSCIADLSKKYPNAIEMTQFARDVLRMQATQGYVDITQHQIQQIEEEMINPLIDHLRRALGLQEEDRRPRRYREEEEYRGERRERPRESQRSRRARHRERYESSSASESESESVSRPRGRGRGARRESELARELRDLSGEIREGQRTFLQQQNELQEQREQSFKAEQEAQAQKFQDEAAKKQRQQEVTQQQLDFQKESTRLLGEQLELAKQQNALLQAKLELAQKESAQEQLANRAAIDQIIADNKAAQATLNQACVQQVANLRDTLGQQEQLSKKEREAVAQQLQGLQEGDNQINRSIAALDASVKQTHANQTQLLAKFSDHEKAVQQHQVSIQQLLRAKSAENQQERAAAIREAVQQTLQNVHQANQAFQQQLLGAVGAKTQQAIAEQVQKFAGLEQTLNKQLGQLDAARSTFASAAQEYQVALQQLKAKPGAANEGELAQLKQAITESLEGNAKASDDLRKELQAKEKEFEQQTRDAHAAELQSLRDIHAAEKAQLQARLDAQQQTQATLHQQMATLNDSMKGIAQSSATLSGDLKRYQQTIDALNTASQAQQPILGRLETASTQIVASQQATQASMAAISDQLKQKPGDPQLSSELETLQGINKRFDEQMGSLNTMMGQHLARMSQTLDANAQKYEALLQAQRDEKAASLQENQQRQRDLQNAYTSLDRAVLEATQTLQQLAKEAGGAQAAAIEAQQRALGEQVEALSTLRDTIQGQVQSIQTTIDEKLNASQEALTTQMQQLETNVADNFQALVDRPSVLPEDLSDQLQAVADLHKETRDFVQTAKDQEARIHRIDSARSEQILQQNEQLTQRMAQLEKAAQKLHAKSDEVTRGVEQLAKFQGAVEGQEKAITALVAQLQEKNPSDQEGKEQVIKDLVQVQNVINERLEERRKEIEQVDKKADAILAQLQLPREGGPPGRLEERENLEEQLELIKKAKKELAEQHAELKSSQSSVTAALEKAESTLRLAEAENTALLASQKQLQIQNGALTAKFGALEDGRRTAQETAEANQREISRLEAKNQTLEETLESNKVRLREQTEAAQGKAEALAKLEAVQASVVKHETALAQSKEEIDKLSAKNEELQETIERTNYELQALKKNNARNASALEGQITPKQLQERIDEIGNLEEQITILNDELKKQKLDNTTLTRQLAAARGNLQHAIDEGGGFERKGIEGLAPSSPGRVQAQPRVNISGEEGSGFDYLSEEEEQYEQAAALMEDVAEQAAALGIIKTESDEEFRKRMEERERLEQEEEAAAVAEVSSNDEILEALKKELESDEPLSSPETSPKVRKKSSSPTAAAEPPKIQRGRPPPRSKKGIPKASSTKVRDRSTTPPKKGQREKGGLRRESTLSSSSRPRPPKTQSKGAGAPPGVSRKLSSKKPIPRAARGPFELQIDQDIETEIKGHKATITDFTKIYAGQLEKLSDAAASSFVQTQRDVLTSIQQKLAQFEQEQQVLIASYQKAGSDQPKQRVEEQLLEKRAEYEALKKQFESAKGIFSILGPALAQAGGEKRMSRIFNYLKQDNIPLDDPIKVFAAISGE